MSAASQLPVAADDQPDASPTFFSHALALAARHGPGPWPRDGHPLPDEETDARPLLSRTVLDGVATHHTRRDADPPAATAIADEVQELLSNLPSVPAFWQFHDRLAAVDTLGVADGLGTALRGRDLPRNRLRTLARWLVRNGTRRNAVATGVVLLGLAGDERDRDLLLLLGTLGDLTLYAAVALRRTQSDRERAVYLLARRVTGWGRIHAVERLRGTDDPEIKAWLLRDGFRNSVMNEYLAHLAATTGDLCDALSAPDVDDALLDDAGDILDALAIGGPAEDMADYPDGPAALARYLSLVLRRPPTLRRVVVVLRLGLFLDRAARLDWPHDAVARLRCACQSAAADPDWRDVVADALASEDLDTFRRAIFPARKLGLPTCPAIRVRLRRDPTEPYLWQSLLNCPTGDLAGSVALAESLLPLAELGAGPPSTDVLGRSAADHALDCLVSFLRKHPGRGWPLIRAALGNPTVRNRNMAVHALAEWPRDAVSADMVAAVGAMADAEPDEELRNRARTLLSGWNG